MIDFTLTKYQQLLKKLLQEGYAFQPFENFILNPSKKTVILRHDVDSLPGNSLKTAQIENGLGIQGTYYFRIVPQSNQPEIIQKIAELDHEIGYHYEDIDLTAKKHNSGKEEDLANKAIELFEKNLYYLRGFYPVKTICMHGSPMSKHDNKLLWKYYDYRNYGIIAEPYLDTDFSKVLYLTDTGRNWNGEKMSIRDKVDGKTKINNYHFKETDDIIKSLGENLLPNQIMITLHPQRWTNNSVIWTKELIWQNVKNQVKKVIVARRNS